MSGQKVWSASNNSPVGGIVVAVALACLCLLLFSCPSPDTIGQIAADLGFSIVSTIPPNGDSNFGPGQPIVVTFDRDLDPACLQGVAPVVIATDPEHPLTLMFSLDGPRKLIVEPHPYLQSNHTYTVSLETTLKDSSGATLPRAVALTFTTGDAPAGDFKINGGAAYVNSGTVALDVDHNAAATRMRVANSSDALANLDYEATASKSWDLDAGDGSKTVYVQFANDNESMTSPVRSVGAVLDTHAPTIDLASVAQYYNQSNDSSNALRPSVAATDDRSGIDSYMWSGEGVSFNTSAPYSDLSPRLRINGLDGSYSFSVIVKDRAGNSATSQLPLTVIKDTTPPTTPSPGVEVSPPAVLDGNNLYWSWTASSLPNPYPTADTLQAALNGSPVVGETQYGPISVGDGTYTLAVVQRDAAGNESQPLLMPVVVSPIIPPDGSAGVSQTPYLKWRAFATTAGKSLYQVTLWPSDAPSEQVVLAFPWTIQTTEPIDLAPGKTYYWYIEYFTNSGSATPTERRPPVDGTYYRFTTIP